LLEAVRQKTALTRPIRVVRIIDRLNVGGPAKHVAWLTAGLDRDNFESFLITGTIPDGEGDMTYFARSAGVEPIVIKQMSRELSPWDLIVVFRLILWFWKLKPDVIHTHKAKAGAAGRAAAFVYKWATVSALWLRPRPCVVVHTYHGHIFYGYYGRLKTALFIAIERMMARLCTDRIIAISKQQREEIMGRFKVGRPDQYRVVPLGIDFDEVVDVPGCLRADVKAAANSLVVGIIGRLCEVKNQSMLIDAAAALCTRVSKPESAADDVSLNVRFVVIGDGPLRAALEEQAHAAGIADLVTFTGFRKDAGSLYSDLDLVALTSLNEGTPLTVIEALAAGRAVVTTEVGGVVDLMGERQYQAGGFFVWDHGVTVPGRDPETFAKALRFLIERPELRQQMGARGRAFVRAELSTDRLIRDIQDLYSEALGQQPAVSAHARAAV
jgi:glycosyltransferase involved in cell wall biosynthesis